jgi:hypothetical protein
LRGFALELSVPYVNQQIGGDHKHIDNVKNKNVPFLRKRRHIRFVSQLGDYSGYVTENNKAQKHGAFAPCAFGLIRTYDAERPRRAEA